MKYKESLTAYKTSLGEASAKFKDIITNELPMDMSFTYSVKKHPVMPTTEQLSDARFKIETLRTTLTAERTVVQTERRKQIDELVEQMKQVLPATETKGRRTVPAKWIGEIYNASTWSEPYNSFWSDSKRVMDAIDAFAREQKDSESKRKQYTEKQAQVEWCKRYITNHMPNITQMVLQSISPDTIIDLACSNLKANYSVAEGLTGEKCYCDAHAEARHHHFADVYWDGVGFITYSNSETY
jgi:hypothetical protein